MKPTRLFAVILAMIMTVALFSCGNGGGKDPVQDPLTAEYCLDLIFKNSIPKIEATTVSTEIKVLSTNELDPYGGIVFKSIVSPEAESVVSLEITDRKGDKADMTVYSGSTGAVVSSNLFDDSYLLSVEALKLLLGSGSAGQMAGGIFSGEVGGMSQNPELSAIINKYVTLLGRAISSASENKLTIDGESVGVKVTFNGDSVKKIVKDLYTEAKNDQTLKKLILEAVEKADPDDYDEIAAEYDKFFASEDGLNELFREINEYADLKLVFNVVADRNYKLRSCGAELTADGNKAVVEYSTSIKDSEKSSVLTVSYKDAEDGEEGEYVLTETLKTENGASSYALKLLADGMELSIVDLELKADGVYTVTVGGMAAVKGTYSSKNGKTEITVREAAVGFETVELNISVTVDSKATLPEFPTDYKMLSELSGKELADIVDSIRGNEIVNSVYEYLTGIIGGIGGNEGEAFPDEF